MAKKKIGYIELHWKCLNCGTINPGPEKICKGCAAPQPPDVEFFQPSRQELIADEERLKQAQAGADIHCAYCGTRNPAGAARCSQCKADLTEGKQRQAGKVVGAFRKGPQQMQACPHCGAENPETQSRCRQCGGSLKAGPPEKKQPEQQTAPAKLKPGVLAVIGLVLIAACLGMYFLFFRTSAVQGTVTDVRWERAVVIEQVVQVRYQDWWDEIPVEGEVITCSLEARGETDVPTEGAQEICGTPYSIDTGGGFAEVVEDCTYIIYDDYCTYTLWEWAAVESATVSGDDLMAFWPDPDLASDQRLGAGSETYFISFEADGQKYLYQTEDYQLFTLAVPGSRWELEINSIGGVQSARP
jgi:ribosomal protein L40E